MRAAQSARGGAPYWMQPSDEMWAPAQLAQLLPTQQPPLAQGFWESVMIRPMSPVG